MKKLISIVLLLNLCLAIDEVAVEAGFIADTAGALNQVSIDSKVAIKIHNQNETLKCQSLHIQTGGELEFTKSPSLESKANVTIESSEDMVINGKLTVSPGIDLTLISQSFAADSAAIEAPVFSVKSKEISIVASEIFSKKLSLGALSKTTSILLDKESKIGGDFAATIKFYAKDIQAHCLVLGSQKSILFTVVDSIDIDGFTKEKVDFKSVIIINYGTNECVLESALDGAACESSAGSLLANIKRLLEFTNVSMHSNHQILMNSKLEVANSSCELKLYAPIIDIKADIKAPNLFLCGPEMSKIQISAGINLLAKKLKLSNKYVEDTITIPITKQLEVTNSDINIGDFSHLSIVFNQNSRIDLLGAIPAGFKLDWYEFKGVINTADRLHTYAKTLVLNNITMDAEQSFAIPSGVNELHVNNSCIIVSNLSGLSKIFNQNSIITYIGEIPAGFKLDCYVFTGVINTADRLYPYAKTLVVSNLAIEQNFYIPARVKRLEVINSSIKISGFSNLSIVKNHSSRIEPFRAVPAGFKLDWYQFTGAFNSADRLHTYAKTLILEDITMDADQSFALPSRVKRLEVIDSSIKISNLSHLSKIFNQNSIITYFGEIPAGFKLDEYVFKGAFNSTDRLHTYARALFLNNITMDAEQSFAVPLGVTRLEVINSSINISNFSNLSKVLNQNSRIELVVAVPPGFQLDCYVFKGVTNCTDRLHTYAKTLVLNSITMDAEQNFYIPARVKRLEVINSSINISNFSNLSIVINQNSNIEPFRAVPAGFKLFLYEFKEAFNSTDRLHTYARLLVLNNITMDAGQSFALPHGVTRLEVINSSINISNLRSYSSFSHLSTVLNQNSRIELLVAVPPGFKLNEYMFKGVIDSTDRLHTYAGTLALNNITMDAEQSFALPSRASSLSVENSSINISNFINLRKVRNQNSRIELLEAVPVGFKLDWYEFKEAFNSTDRLHTYAKTLILDSITMDAEQTFALPSGLEELQMIESSISISNLSRSIKVRKIKTIYY